MTKSREDDLHFEMAADDEKGKTPSSSSKRISYFFPWVGNQRGETGGEVTSAYTGIRHIYQAVIPVYPN